MSSHTVLTFEISNDCNLRNVHKECPINARKYRDTSRRLNDNAILEGIRQAKTLHFTGFIAFHYYNEPMLELDRILKIIEKTPDTHFLLWTNGTLLDREVENNRFLEKFSGVVVSCYSEKDKPFFEKLKAHYSNVQINDFKLDSRLNVYDRDPVYHLSCKRPLLELPIDFYGNAHICCMDWNNSYPIGNILATSLIEVVQGSRYQKILKQANQQWLSEASPALCQKCFKRLFVYHKSDFFRKGTEQ